MCVCVNSSRLCVFSAAARRYIADEQTVPRDCATPAISVRNARAREDEKLQSFRSIYIYICIFPRVVLGLPRVLHIRDGAPASDFAVAREDELFMGDELYIYIHSRDLSLI